MRIGLAQIDTVAGDLEGNSSRIVDGVRKARARGAEIVLFPELTLCGYDARDLLRMPSFLESAERALRALAAEAELKDGVAVVVGFPEPNPGRHGAPAFNSCAIMKDGEIGAVARKCLIPSYDVLEEHRHFEPSNEVTVTKVGDLVIGLSICEDLWSSKLFHDRPRHSREPAKELVARGADVILNLSASPFHQGKPALRERMLSSLASEVETPVAMTNLVGGNDGTIFDGTSLAIDGAGHTVGRCESFMEDLRVFDMFGTEREAPLDGPEEPRRLDEIHDAIVLGIRDYCRKTGFDRVVLGLSGGIDSALVAALAAEALGPDRVLAVAMPSRYSSPASTSDAADLATSLGLELREISIEKPFSAVLDVLEPHLGTSSGDESAPIIDVAHENIQPRLRAIYLMALSNRLGHLLLVPGNKSEIAVGYSTLYGDMAGGIAPIGDVLKTTAYALATRINERAGRDIIPRSIIHKAPSAELRPDQRDEDSLPPYEILDPIIAAFVEEALDLEGIVRRGHDKATARRVIEMIVRAEHKRRQAAPVIKISPAPFGYGFRLPMAGRYLQPEG